MGVRLLTFFCLPGVSAAARCTSLPAADRRNCGGNGRFIALHVPLHFPPRDHERRAAAVARPL
jgi:hypothetical protein